MPPFASYSDAATLHAGSAVTENHSQEPPTRRHYGIALAGDMDVNHLLGNNNEPVAAQALHGMASMNPRLTVASTFVEYSMDGVWAIPSCLASPPSPKSWQTSPPMELVPCNTEPHYNMMDMQQRSSAHMISNATRDRTASTSPKFQCTQPGCAKTYCRKGHLKRHLRSQVSLAIPHDMHDTTLT